MTEYIDRNTALKNVCFDCCENGECNIKCREYLVMKAIPAADVQPIIHAHWIEKKHPQYPDICHNKYFCSHCNKEAPTYYLDYSHETISEKWDYCPYCGAKMDEKE